MILSTEKKYLRGSEIVEESSKNFPYCKNFTGKIGLLFLKITNDFLFCVDRVLMKSVRAASDNAKSNERKHFM
jgi:hypothetical protein